MKTTIATARRRIANAEIVAADFRGEQDLRLRVIGEYTVVDDGQDCWLCSTADLASAIEKIVGDVLDGNYDDKLDDSPQLQCTAYSDLCSVTHCIYSRIGSPSDIGDVADLDVDGETRTAIVEELGITKEFGAAYV